MKPSGNLIRSMGLPWRVAHAQNSDGVVEEAVSHYTRVRQTLDIYRFLAIHFIRYFRDIVCVAECEFDVARSRKQTGGDRLEAAYFGKM